MIAPKSNVPEPGLSLQDATDEIFKPGGRLEKAGRAEALEYEARPQQREMALAVADAFENGHHLAIEAGTGVGKSYAYLVPLILYALREKVQVVVSTYTISLQEQLMTKDIPFLKQHLGMDFKAVMVKGRGNYLCLRRLARARKMGGELFKAKQEDELEHIRAWADRTEEGSLQDMQDQPSSEVWGTVSVEHGNCLWQKCPEYKPCFFMKARAQMRDAHLLVVNHHLFFSDLALRAQGAALLPDSAVCVLDEAHSMESVASEHMGLRLSQLSFEHWMRRLYSADNGKGLLAALQKGDVAHGVTMLGEEVDRFFLAVREWAGFNREKSRQLVESPLDIETNIPAMMGKINGQLADLADAITDEDSQAELRSAARRGSEMRSSLIAFLDQALEDQVYWVESEGARRQQTVLYSAPIEVGPALNEKLFSHFRSAVMTSATLGINGSLDYFKTRIGAEDAESRSVGSPFDYTRQMKIHLPLTMPDPNDFDAYADACARAIRHYVQLTQGRAFVLFTSDRFMKAVADQTRAFFADQGYPFFQQGEGLPRNVMLEKFRKDGGSVLFGLDSFWMGVDVRGEALSNVIITKLPFAVPDEPVVKARMDRIKEKGGDPFRDYSLPEAILKLRQGVGRLIRSATDEGIAVILDPRVRKKWYGRHFLDALPECPVEEDDILP